jgi:hypothetical protein
MPATKDTPSTLCRLHLPNATRWQHNSQDPYDWVSTTERLLHHLQPPL